MDLNRQQRRALKNKPVIDRNAKFREKLPLLERMRDGFEPLEKFLSDCLSEEGVDVDESGTPIIVWDDNESACAMSSVLLMLEFTYQCLVMQRKSTMGFEMACRFIKRHLKSKMDVDCPVERKDILFAKETVAWAKQVVVTTPNDVRVRILDEISKVTQRVDVTKVSEDDLREWLR